MGTWTIIAIVIAVLILVSVGSIFFFTWKYSSSTPINQSNSTPQFQRLILIKNVENNFVDVDYLLKDMNTTSFVQSSTKGSPIAYPLFNDSDVLQVCANSSEYYEGCQVCPKDCELFLDRRGDFEVSIGNVSENLTNVIININNGWLKSATICFAWSVGILTINPLKQNLVPIDVPQDEIFYYDRCYSLSDTSVSFNFDVEIIKEESWGNSFKVLVFDDLHNSSAEIII